MIKISFRQYPPEGMAYTLDAFKSSIGKKIPFQMEGTPLDAEVTEAEVLTDGFCARITLSVPVTFPALVDGLCVPEKEES